MNIRLLLFGICLALVVSFQGYIGMNINNPYPVLVFVFFMFFCQLSFVLIVRKWISVELVRMTVVFIGGWFVALAVDFMVWSSFDDDFFLSIRHQINNGVFWNNLYGWFVVSLLYLGGVQTLLMNAIAMQMRNKTTGIL